MDSLWMNSTRTLWFGEILGVAQGGVKDEMSKEQKL